MFAIHYYMLANVYSAALNGIEASIIKVEVDVLSKGLPGWNMVGLLETAVKEAKDRVGSAIRNAGFTLPNRKTIINLSPADIKKSGAHYDLAIAISLLTAVSACQAINKKRYLVAGELSLAGKVLPISGALLLAIAAREKKLDGVILPRMNAWEAKLACDIEVIPVSTLAEAAQFLNTGEIPPLAEASASEHLKTDMLDLGEVRGQPFAKRGLEIAAAGGHNIALKGPPGTGKTMLAERLPSILPPLTHEESLEVAKVLSWHGMLKNSFDFPKERPFRAPHHTASYAGLIGGSAGGNPRLGEISLAHNGVLFLDELGEFRKDVIEVLRQPMESGKIRIIRAGVAVTFPAHFQLAVSFNPCKCGYITHPTKPCTCSMQQIRQYRSKLSGPLIDRIDLHIEVGPPPHEALIDSFHEESSEAVKARVIEARKRQYSRYKKDGKCNAHLSSKEINIFCKLGKAEKIFLKSAATNLNLSARSVHRVIKVARTIADLAGKEEISTDHIAEAVQFRPNMEDSF